jgi:RNA recognition motif-containing protein
MSVASLSFLQGDGRIKSRSRNRGKKKDGQEGQGPTTPNPLRGKKKGQTPKHQLFIGGIAPSTSEEALHQYFEQFGQLLACEIKTDTNTGKGRGFGFVSYADPKSKCLSQNVCI